MERDYPIGHPAASDYKGERYVPPRAPFAEDFPPDHPARAGKNITALDTPDGMRAQTVQVWQENAKRTAESEPERNQAAAEHSSRDVAPTETTFTITGEVQTTTPER